MQHIVRIGGALHWRLGDVRFWLLQARRAILMRGTGDLQAARAHIHAPRTLGNLAADRLTQFAGSWPFVVLHVGWFSVWLWLHLDINLLTLIVSLEAIFLATFVLMSQNRQAQKDQTRDDTEAIEVEQLYQINREQLEILRLLREQRAAMTSTTTTTTTTTKARASR